MKNVVIVGAGDLGKELVWLIEDINRKKPTYLILGFLDDDTAKDTYSFYGYRVLGGTDQLERLNERIPCQAVLALRDGANRQRMVEAHPAFDGWETIVHPTATVASGVSVGRGCVLFPQVTVSVDSRLGPFGIYGSRVTIGNDCWVGDYVTAGMGVLIPERSSVGTGRALPAGAVVRSWYDDEGT